MLFRSITRKSSTVSNGMTASDSSVMPEISRTKKESPLVKVLSFDDALAGLTSESLRFGDESAALILAFISPQLDFSAIVETLHRLGKEVPVIAMTTAGELCSIGGGDFYRPADKPSMVVQVFSRSLLAQVSIHAIPLPNDDIRGEGRHLTRDERLEMIVHSLQNVALPFRLNVNETLALTFIDGLSSCENYFMEAVYQSARFPCLFIGGSAGGSLDFRHTQIATDGRILENHAVVIFLKLASGKSYSVLKSQNFKKTRQSLVVAEADPDHRMISSIIDSQSTKVVPVVEGLSKMLAVPPDQLVERLTDYTFGIEIDGELFVRSIANINLTAGTISFFCDVNPGDEL